MGKGKSLQSFTSKKKEKAEISASKLLLSIFWSKKRHCFENIYIPKKKPNSVHVYASVGIFVCAFFNTFHTWSSPPEKETTNPPEE